MLILIQFYLCHILLYFSSELENLVSRSPREIRAPRGRTTTKHYTHNTAMADYTHNILSSGIAVAYLCSLLHVYFMVIESFQWRAKAPKAFGVPAHALDATTTLATNQGFYNLILAVGLLSSLWSSSLSQVNFFLLSMLAAGVVGWLTVSRTILIVQFMPAFIAFALINGQTWVKDGDLSLYTPSSSSLTPLGCLVVAVVGSALFASVAGGKKQSKKE